MVVVGAVMLTLSVVVGVLGGAVVLRVVDPQRFERDVALEGDAVVDVPARQSFEVVEPLRPTDDEVMTVAVASGGTGLLPVCTIASEDGGPVEQREPQGTEVFLREPAAEVEVVATARLGPGTYVASCEPSGKTERTMTVGRVFAADDVRTLAGPLLGLAGVLLVAGGLFVVGGVLLVVGLVRRSRYRNEQAGRPPLG